MAEIKNSEDFENWLKGKPAAIAQVIAARIALRVLPLIHTRDSRADLTRTVFRAVLISWAARSYPARDLTHAARAARAALETRAARAAYAAYATDVGAYAVSSAADNAADNAANAARAARAAYAAYVANVANVANVAAYASIWQAVEDDANMLGPQNRGATALNAQDLAARSLWSRAVPVAMGEQWQKLKNELLSLNQDWDIWIDWYEQRLQGTSIAFRALPIAYDDVTASIAMEDNRFWDRDPAIVNADIKSRLEAKRPEEAPLPTISDAPVFRDFEIPPQKPATIEPVIIDGKITLSMSPVETDIDRHSFGDLLQMLKAILGKLCLKAKAEGNIDHRPAEAMESLASLISENVPKQSDMFEIAHGLDVLIEYNSIVVEQWPDFLTKEYAALLKTYDRVIKQVPRWREMISIANQHNFSADQIKSAPDIAEKISTDLRKIEIIAPVVATELNELSKTRKIYYDSYKLEQNRNLNGVSFISEDIVDSINNIFKSIAKFITIKNAMITVGGLSGGALAIHELCANYGPYLISTFPQQFAWLKICMKALGWL